MENKKKKINRLRSEWKERRTETKKEKAAEQDERRSRLSFVKRWVIELHGGDAIHYIGTPDKTKGEEIHTKNIERANTYYKKEAMAIVESTYKHEPELFEEFTVAILWDIKGGIGRMRPIRYSANNIGWESWKKLNEEVVSVMVLKDGVWVEVPQHGRLPEG